MACENDIVRLELLRGNIKPLENIYFEIHCLRSSQELLANVYSPDHTLGINFGTERYMPKNTCEGKDEACTATR